MVQTMTNYDFCRWFETSESRKDQFSHKALLALYDYLEQLYDDLGETYEFDPIALCVEYTEYDNALEAMEQYQPEDMPVEGEEGDDLLEIQAKNEAAALEWLEDRTQVIQIDGSDHIIIADF